MTSTQTQYIFRQQQQQQRKTRHNQKRFFFVWKKNKKGLTADLNAICLPYMNSMSRHDAKQQHINQTATAK